MKWKCGSCRNVEDSPIAEKCPECGLTGERFPLDRA